jgi:anti-sigma B factor antagonist
MGEATMAHPRLSVSRSRRGESEIVHIAGEVDMSSVDTLEQNLLNAVATASPPAPIILECSGVTFLGSCGISLLLSVHSAALSQDTPMRIVAPQRAVRRPIHLIGYDGTLQLHNTLVDAVKRSVPARSGI